MNILMTACSAATAQYGDVPVACGSSLPMTGYAAILVLVLGLVALTVGLILRKRTDDA